MTNKNLAKARNLKNDEFYTQYEYIEKEINIYVKYNKNIFKNKIVFLPCDNPERSNFTKFFIQNFEKFNLKKLISTSYDNKNNGKLFILEKNINNNLLNYNDVQWKYLDGNGDFRSNEIKKFRDEADFIITNPPFSLFKEFIPWIMESEKKKFLIIGNMNAITYKEVFPFIKDNKIWLGATGYGHDMVFEVPEGANIALSDKIKAEKLGYKGNYTRLGNSCWFTNMDHYKRHEKLELMTMEDNLKLNKKLLKKLKGYGFEKYFSYDKYDTIEIPFVKAIPSDYNGSMGVPISFLDKYNPEQFKILGLANDSRCVGDCNVHTVINNKKLYNRLIIKKNT